MLRRAHQVAHGAGRRRRTATTLAFDDVAIDLAQRARHARAAQEVKLTHLEFELLVFFVRHPSQVFSRTQLFNLVWGQSAGLGAHRRQLRRPAPQAVRGQPRAAAALHHRARLRLPLRSVARDDRRRARYARAMAETIFTQDPARRDPVPPRVRGRPRPRVPRRQPDLARPHARDPEGAGRDARPALRRRRPPRSAACCRGIARAVLAATGARAFNILQNNGAARAPGRVPRPLPHHPEARRRQRPRHRLEGRASSTDGDRRSRRRSPPRYEAARGRRRARGARRSRRAAA